MELILDELRRFGTDTQDVEAKRAGDGLPGTTSETLSAFGSAEGGLYLLGVVERAGEFDVTGVGDPGRVLAALQADFAEVDPPIRALIETIAHPTEWSSPPVSHQRRGTSGPRTAALWALMVARSSASETATSA